MGYDDAFNERPAYTPVLPVTFGRFVTPLRVEVLHERDPSGRQLYRLLADFIYQTSDGIFIDVPRGFIFDGESIPKAFRSIAGDDSLKGAAIHDYGYRTHDPDDRGWWDRTYREVLLTDGVHVVEADTKYGTVTFYGEPSWASGPSRLRVEVLG